jgi:hypothetical protein
VLDTNLTTNTKLCLNRAQRIDVMSGCFNIDVQWCDLGQIFAANVEVHRTTQNVLSDDFPDPTFVFGVLLRQLD